MALFSRHHQRLLSLVCGLLVLFFLTTQLVYSLEKGNNNINYGTGMDSFEAEEASVSWLLTSRNYQRNVTNKLYSRDQQEQKEQHQRSQQYAKIIISQSLCVSTPSSSSSWHDATITTTNDNNFKKTMNRATKPYDLAAIYATHLWLQQMPPGTVQVLTLLVHYDDNDDKVKTAASRQKLQEMTRRLKQAGGLVWTFNLSSLYSSPVLRHTACIKASQLGRMFAHQHLSVSASDKKKAKDHNDHFNDANYSTWIITSDVDAFPVNARLLLRQPIMMTKSSNNNKHAPRMWIHNTERALKNNHSWPLCFIGMSARDWNDTLQGDTLESVLREQLNSSNDKNKVNVNWNGDQIYLTSKILQRGLCTLPHSHKAWKRLAPATKRESNTSFLLLLHSANDHKISNSNVNDTTTTCLQDEHGDSALCKWNERGMIRKACQWLHFWPHNQEADMTAAYQKLSAKTNKPTGKHH